MLIPQCTARAKRRLTFAAIFHVRLDSEASDMHYLTISDIGER